MGWSSIWGVFFPEVLPNVERASKATTMNNQLLLMGLPTTNTAVHF